MGILDYVVIREELNKVSWYSRVLQGDFRSYGNSYSLPWYKEFHAFVNGVKKKVISKEIDMESFNKLIQEKALQLQEDYAEDFSKVRETLGWYNQQLLVSMYLEDKITIDGRDFSKERADKLLVLAKIKEVQAEKRRIKAEAAVLATEIKARKALEAEEARVVVTKGMIFLTKTGMLYALIGISPKDSPCLTEAAKEALLQTYLGVYFVKRGINRGWKVVSILKEGCRAWSGSYKQFQEEID